MQKLKIRQGEWVIVCDGKKALILENVGDEKFLNLKTREVQEHADPKTSDLGTGAPGRAFNSVGGGRSAVEQTDWHKQEEDRFLQKLVGQLDHAVEAGEVKSLVIVAPPRALLRGEVLVGWAKARNAPCPRASHHRQKSP